MFSRSEPFRRRIGVLLACLNLLSRSSPYIFSQFHSRFVWLCGSSAQLVLRTSLHFLRLHFNFSILCSRGVFSTFLLRVFEFDLDLCLSSQGKSSSTSSPTTLPASARAVSSPPCSPATCEPSSPKKPRKRDSPSRKSSRTLSESFCQA